MLLFAAPFETGPLHHVDDAMERWDAEAGDVRAAFDHLENCATAQEVGLVVAIARLDLAVLRAQLAASVATTTHDVGTALRTIAVAARHWLDDPAVRARIDAIASAEHAHSVRIRVEGAADEAERVAAAVETSLDHDVHCAQAAALRLVGKARLTLVDVASSVRHSA